MPVPHPLPEVRRRAQRRRATAVHRPVPVPDSDGPRPPGRVPLRRTSGGRVTRTPAPPPPTEKPTNGGAGVRVEKRGALLGVPLTAAAALSGRGGASERG